MTKRQISSHQKEQAITSYLKETVVANDLVRSFGVAKSTVYRWIANYRTSGNLERTKNPASGRQSKINIKNGKLILKVLKKPASYYGYETDFWTTLRVQQILNKELKLDVSRMSIHRTLKKLKLSYYKPESRYYHKDKKKNIYEWEKKTVPAIKRAVKKHNAILYFEDECNISLTPSVAKTWGPQGQKLVNNISPNRGSVSAISAISKSGYLVFNIHDGSKRFNSDDIIQFLAELLRHHPRRHLVVVMDQAPCHKSLKVKHFVEDKKQLHVFYLPPRTPEFNPDEMVWAHLKGKELKGHKASTTKELTTLARKKLKKISDNKQLIEGIYSGSDGAVFFN